MKEKNFMSLCDCGCGDGLVIQHMDGILYVSFLSGDWYTHQECTVLKTLKKAFLGSRIVKEILVDVDELKRMRDYIKSFELSDKEVDNSSHIAIYGDSVDGFNGICLVSDLKLSQIGKPHLLFEIELNKGLRDKLVRKINKAIKVSANV